MVHAVETYRTLSHEVKIEIYRKKVVWLLVMENSPSFSLPILAVLWKITFFFLNLSYIEMTSRSKSSSSRPGTHIRVEFLYALSLSSKIENLSENVEIPSRVPYLYFLLITLTAKGQFPSLWMFSKNPSHFSVNWYICIYIAWIDSHGNLRTPLCRIVYNNGFLAWPWKNIPSFWIKMFNNYVPSQSNQEPIRRDPINMSGTDV